MTVRRVIRLIVPFVLMISSSFAVEMPPIDVVPIGKIFASLQSYNLHVVKLEGIVKSIVPITRAAMCGLGDGYVLTLEDETGRIEVADYGVCDGQTAVWPLLAQYPVSIGDKVILTVIISEIFSSNFGQSQIGAALRWIERLPTIDGPK